MAGKRSHKSDNLFLLIIFILLGVQLSASAQSSPKIDSLKQKLSMLTDKQDSISILCELTWRISFSDPNLTYKYSMKALELSKDLQNMELLALVYDGAAIGYWVKGDLQKAREYFNKELVIAEAHKFLFRIAWGNFNLADISLKENKLNDVSYYALKSRAAFKQLNNLKMAIQSDWLLINSNNNYKNTYVDSTINDYILAVSLTVDSNVLLDQYLNLIYLYGQKENRSKSMFYAMRALDIAEETKNEKAILNTYFQIGNYLRDYQHNYEVALLYYNKVLEIIKEKKEELGIAQVLIDVGNVHKLMGKDSLALALFNESLEIAKKLNHRHSIADAYKSIGEIYYLEKNYKDALTYYVKCYETGCDKCPPIVFHKVLLDIGKVYLNAKDYANAEKYFRKSLLLADSANTDYERAASYSALADIYNSLNNTAAAVNNYHTALNLATDINSLSLRKEISAKLSKAYQQQKNYQKAFEYLYLSNTLADSLNKMNEAENLSRLETKFEFQNMKMQKELELKESQITSKAEIEKQKQLTYFFIFGFVLVTVLGFVVYMGFRRKKKDNVTLETQKKQLEEMSGKIHEADQKRLSFFTNISHELRTPLTLILGPIEKLLKENFHVQSSLSLLNIVRRNTLQLNNLINQLLDIRKLDTGNVKLNVSRGDIINYCKGIYSTFSHLADEKNITYVFNTAEEKITCWFDKDIVEKTLNNLLSNAFKYTPKCGEISMTVFAVSEIEREISHAKIIIRDNGKGIPEEQLQYVFDRYYQVENTNTGFNTGTGIGLAYSKELIELHKGEINIESRVNHGTNFMILLPVHESDYSQNEKSSGDIDVKEIDANDVRQKYLEQLVESELEIADDRVEFNPVDERNVLLIVEDNADLRSFIKSIFANDYEIYEAPDGISGYQMANKIIPDVIISDIMMPGMNGLEFCTKLKSNIHTNHIPLLILTAKAGEENELLGLKTGAEDYLTKPFSSEILEIRIKKLIDLRERLREHFTREFLLNPKEIKLTSPDDEFLKKAVKVVEDNITNPNLNVEMLMYELGVSRTQLFRKLKAITNYSASQFIRNIKLKRAAQFLQNKSYNITQVLYLSGFNSPSYFTACFKEMYGCLPKEYNSRTDSTSVLTN